MPKRKRPGGRRQSASFDPRYARKKAASPGKSRRPQNDRRRRDDERTAGERNGYEKPRRTPRGHDWRASRDHDKPRSRDNDNRASRDHAGQSSRERGPRSFRDHNPRQSRDHVPRKAGASAPRTTHGHKRRDAAGQNRSPRTFRQSPERSAPRTPQVDDTVLERLQATAQDASTTDATFAELGLGTNIVAALEKLGASTPFPIQAATIPDIIAGRDLLGRGRTGSGKTIAFGAGTVERLMNLWAARDKSTQKRSYGRAPRALMLAPTRELALQLDRTVQPLARSVGLFTTQVYGGVPQGRQVGALKRGVDIVIGTPGRIEDLVAQGHLDLSQVVISVIDEADHMSELGFIEPVQRILRLTDPGAQRLLFSATLDTQVAGVIDEFLTDPAVHEVASDDSGTIDHQMLVIDHRQKLDVIEELARREGKVLVFARTRNYTDQLADMLSQRGIPAVSLHGDIKQARRQRNLDKLARGSVRVLVATDVAARGIHVDDVQLVVQADAPTEYKAYLHRAGRTGRAGHDGTVITLVTKARKRALTELLSRAEVQASVSYAERPERRVS